RPHRDGVRRRGTRSLELARPLPRGAGLDRPPARGPLARGPWDELRGRLVGRPPWRRRVESEAGDLPRYLLDEVKPQLVPVVWFCRQPWFCQEPSTQMYMLTQLVSPNRQSAPSVEQAPSGAAYCP